MTEEKRNRLVWGILLLVGALGSASLRNNPALGIRPLAVGIIEGIIYACILGTVCLSDWRMAAFTALVTPVYLWVQRFLDGFMIPVDMIVNVVLVFSMAAALKVKWPYWQCVLTLAAPAFAAMMIGSTAAIWLVKQENIVRAFIVAWNTDVYSGLSMLGAALACAPFAAKRAR